MTQVATLADPEFDALAPRVRADAIVRHYDNESVAWSPDASTPLYLDGVASVVLQLLDGDVALADLVTDIHEVVGVPRPIARNQLRRVIALLDEAALLTNSHGMREIAEERGVFAGPLNP